MRKNLLHLGETLLQAAFKASRPSSSVLQIDRCSAGELGPEGWLQPSVSEESQAETMGEGTPGTHLGCQRGMSKRLRRIVLQQEKGPFNRGDIPAGPPIAKQLNDVTPSRAA